MRSFLSYSVWILNCPSHSIIPIQCGAYDIHYIIITWQKYGVSVTYYHPKLYYTGIQKKKRKEEKKTQSSTRTSVSANPCRFRHFHIHICTQVRNAFTCEHESDFDFGITFLGYLVICAPPRKCQSCNCNEKNSSVCGRLECNFLFEIPAAPFAKWLFYYYYYSYRFTYILIWK